MMGMFDYVHFEMDCPKCGSRVSGFQSKDLGCTLATVEPDGLVDFYSSCDSCNAWISFSREYPEVAKRDAYLTVDQVKAMGFVMTITENPK